MLEQLTPILASKKALVGLGIVLFWVLAASIGPFLVPHDPLHQNPDAINSGPSAKHWLGTDDVGRDLLARIIYGARRTLILAPLSVLIALMIGATLGLVGGYFGGTVDELVMRLLDAFMAIPTVLLYLIFISSLGASALNVVLAVAIGGVPGIARLVRGLTLDIRTREYVSAAKLRGEGALYIMFLEILPNARGPIMVDAMLRVGYAVFAIGTLGYLGLGLPPPLPDWGNMVQRAHAFIFSNAWGVLWPALAISSFVVGLNLFVDGWQQINRRYRG